MAKIKFGNLELGVSEEKVNPSLEQEIVILKKKLRNLYILSYVSTILILLSKFINF
jgi:hypothetical protein